MRLSCERLCSHCCVPFAPFAPVIHTRTPFDFRECSAGASVCNAAVNSLWLNHKLRALRECCQFSTGEGLIHSVSDAINQIKHPSALLEEFLRSAYDSRGVPERARDEPIRQTVAVRLATARQPPHMSGFEKLARVFRQMLKKKEKKSCHYEEKKKQLDSKLLLLFINMSNIMQW